MIKSFYFYFGIDERNIYFLYNGRKLEETNNNIASAFPENIVSGSKIEGYYIFHDLRKPKIFGKQLLGKFIFKNANFSFNIGTLNSTKFLIETIENFLVDFKIKKIQQIKQK